MDDILHDVGETMRKYREHVGATQREVADYIGVTPQAISQFERGKSNSLRLYVCYWDYIDGLEYDRWLAV